MHGHKQDASIHAAVALIAVLTLLSFTSHSRGDQSFFMGLGDLPGGTFESHATDISGDGSVVVGYGRNATGTDAFRWTRDAGMTALGAVGADLQRVSTDGSTVVGSAGGSNPFPFRWTQQSG